MVLRDHEDTQKKLKTIFQHARTVGGMLESNRLHTAFGVKDTYQESFMDKIFTLGQKLRGSLAEKQDQLDKLVKSFPPVASPVWRIKGV